MERCYFPRLLLICDSTSDSTHPQQTMEFFPVLSFNILSSQTPHPKGSKQPKVIIFSPKTVPLIKATVRKSYFELFLIVGKGCSETSTQVSQFKTMPFRGKNTTYTWDFEAEKHFLHKTLPFITLCFNESKPLINDAHRTRPYKLDKSLAQKNLLDTPWSFWSDHYTVAAS